MRNPLKVGVCAKSTLPVESGTPERSASSAAVKPRRFIWSFSISLSVEYSGTCVISVAV